LTLEDDPDAEPLPEVNADGGKADDDIKGVPQFWLHVLKNHRNVAPFITERDEEALAYLQDIYVKFLPSSTPGYTLSFYFAPNEFFTNKVLTNTYIYKDVLGELGDYVYSSVEGTTIDWKEEDFTKTHESFFDFFSPAAPLSVDQIEPHGMTEEQLEEHEERVDLDYEFGEELKDRIIARAIHFFTSKGGGGKVWRYRRLTTTVQKGLGTMQQGVMDTVRDQPAELKSHTGELKTMYIADTLYTMGFSERLAVEGTREDVPTGATPRKTWDVVESWERTKSRDDVLKERKDRQARRERQAAVQLAGAGPLKSNFDQDMEVAQLEQLQNPIAQVQLYSPLPTLRKQMTQHAGRPTEVERTAHQVRRFANGSPSTVDKTGRRTYGQQTDHDEETALGQCDDRRQATSAK
ncbi:hypothetical protein FRB90_002449, partial [Tulasnella sp. 427]